MLLGNDGFAAVVGVDGPGVEPIAQRLRQLCLQYADIRGGLYTTDGVEPVGIGVMQDGACAAHVGLGVDGHPEVGWRICNAIPEKARRGNADDREWLRLDGDSGTDD